MSTPVADYELGERLSPDVYLAPAPPRLGLDGAAAVVHVLSALPAGAGESLRRRLQALHLVRSPHLAALVDAGYLPGEGAWYATEDPYTSENQGRTTLGDVHDLPTILAAVAGACRGVHALHQAGLAHGAIGPDAIHVAGGQRGVIDLPVISPEAIGEGRVLDISDPRLLDTVDPAVARGEPPSRASDLWALGATLHEAATGRLLHPGLATDHAIVALQRVMFEPVRIADDLDPAVAAAVASCVARDPAERPPSAEALADHLDTLVAGR